MKYELENDYVKLVVDSYAAEMHEFYLKKDGINILWNGDERYWKGRNPILFPQVGKTKDGTIRFRGKDYQMGNHGICRNREFDLVDKSDSTLHLNLKKDDDTYRIYPYDFSLDVEYQLLNSRLDIAYRITNNDEEMMPFGFGLHPAFKCPLSKDETFEDYRVIFSNNEVLALKEEMFVNDATIIYSHNKYDYCILTNGKQKIKINFIAFPYLAIWKKEKAPFICIEPWLSPSGCFENFKTNPKTDSIIRLSANENMLISYSLEIL